IAGRRARAYDYRSFMVQRLETSNPEGFMQRRHREDVARIERGGLLAPACALDVDDALVVVTRELVDDARIEPGDADEHEARLRMTPPDEFRGIEEVDVPLVALLATDIENEGRARGYAVLGAAARAAS